MKKATLCGLIGAIMICLLQVFWAISNFVEIVFDISVAKITNAVGVIGWLLIGYFFSVW